MKSIIAGWSDTTILTDSLWFLADSITYYYSKQLNSFQKRGASAAFISHMGTDEYQQNADSVIHGMTRYSAFRDSLAHYANLGQLTISNYADAYHISFLQELYKMIQVVMMSTFIIMGHIFPVLMYIPM